VSRLFAPRAAAGLALLLLLALLPWWEGGGTAWGLFVAHTLILTAGALVIVPAMWAGGDGLPRGVEWVGLSAAAFLGACLLSFAFVDYRYGSFLSVWNILMAALLAVVARSADPAWRAPACWIASTLSALQAAGVLILPPPANMTPSGSFANANHLAAFLNIGAFVALGLGLAWMRHGARGRLAAALAGLIVALDAAALLRIGARGALGALVIVFAAWGAASIPRERQAARRLLWGGAAVLILIAAISVVMRFQRVGDPYRYSRIQIWQAGLSAAADAPLVGIGPGMFSRRSWRYNFPQEGEMFRYSKEPRTTESHLVEAVAETGLIGLAALGFLVGALMPRLWRLASGSRLEDAGPALAALACLLQAVVDTPFHAPAVILTLIALLAPRLSAPRPEEQVVLAGCSVDPATRRLAVSAALALAAFAWTSAVLLPWLAHRSYLEAAADPVVIDRAVRLDRFNPLYATERADLITPRRHPLELDALYGADRDLRTALRIDPVNPDYLHQLARLHVRSCFEILSDEASLRRAESLYRHLLALDVKDPRPHLELAAFLEAQGRGSEAIPLIVSALDLEPRYLGARAALASLLADQGRLPESRKAMQDLDRARTELSGYEPRNGYEKDLMEIKRLPAE